MLKRSTAFARWAIFALVLALAPGCLAAAAAGAGAGTGIYLTSQGAGSMVDGSMATVAARTRQVFSDMGIQLAEQTTETGEKIEFVGKKDDLDVKVKLEPEGAGTTEVDVSARRNLVEWDKAYAQQVLQRIVARP